MKIRTVLLKRSGPCKPTRSGCDGQTRRAGEVPGLGYAQSLLGRADLPVGWKAAAAPVVLAGLQKAADRAIIETKPCTELPGEKCGSGAFHSAGGEACADAAGDAGRSPCCDGLLHR